MSRGGGIGVRVVESGGQRHPGLAAGPMIAGAKPLPGPLRPWPTTSGSILHAQAVNAARRCNPTIPESVTAPPGGGPSTSE